MERSIREQNRKFNDDLCFAKTLQHRMLPQRRGEQQFLVDYLYIPAKCWAETCLTFSRGGAKHRRLYIRYRGAWRMSSMMTMFVRQTVRTLAEEGCSPPLVLEGPAGKIPRPGT